MAENVAELQVDGTMAGRIGAARNRARMPRIGGIGLGAVALVVLLTAGVVIHNRGASRPSAPIVSRAVTSQQARFLENNTTNLPNAVAPEVRPVNVTSAQRRLLEVNTIMLPNSVAADVASPVVTSAQQRFLDVNTTWLPAGMSAPYMEEVTPLPGHAR